MNIKDDTFEMLDSDPQKPKKSILLLVLLVLIITGAIPVYLQKQAQTQILPVANTNETVQTETSASSPLPAEKSFPITTVVNFDQASAVINPDQKAKLQAYYQSLKDKTGTLQIDGYTDNEGFEEEGMTLSRQRAEAVAEYLKSLGISSNIALSVSCYGEKNPVGDNSTEQGRQQNRRVELTFTPST